MFFYYTQIFLRQKSKYADISAYSKHLLGVLMLQGASGVSNTENKNYCTALKINSS